MAKPKVQPLTPTLQAGESAPLDDVEITWTRPPRFAGEQGDQKVRISGSSLGAVLAWMARVRPGDPTHLADTEYSASLIEGLAKICNLISRSDGTNDGDATDIFWTLGELLEDIGARIAVRSEDGLKDFDPATIAVRSKKAVA